MPTTSAETLDRELAGLDALEEPLQPRTSLARRGWAASWPKFAAVALVLALWQLVVESGWRPVYVLPPPSQVFGRLWADLLNGELLAAAASTMRRALAGFVAAVFIGVVGGLAISTSRTLRTAVGAGITALQTMPSIAWFPLAILLFKLSEQAIFFVIVLGAAPSIANGLIHGIDHIPPILLRAGKVLGARGLAVPRFIMLPAAMPGFVAGLKQGWAFAWRSLMAGELLVIIARRPSLGARMQYARELSDAEGLLAAMIVILIVGIVVDLLVFARLEMSVRRRWGLAAA